MNYEISGLLGISVDIVPSADLPPKIRDAALREAVPL
jgi:predicted nucleotidyltransferase